MTLLKHKMNVLKAKRSLNREKGYLHVQPFLLQLRVHTHTHIRSTSKASIQTQFALNYHLPRFPRFSPVNPKFNFVFSTTHEAFYTY